MKLHTRTWGAGDKVAVLVHGMFGESRQYWEVGPALADRGFRAIAVDLPGHGHSPPLLQGGLPAHADALADCVPGRPALLLGHSFGAMVAAAALPTIRPNRAIYVDVPFEQGDLARPARDPAALAFYYENAKRTRTRTWLEQTRPSWKPTDCDVEAEAARLFDVETALALEASRPTYAEDVPDTDVPSLLIHADPSDYVSPARVQELRDLGFATRGVPGAGHSVWYGHFSVFMAAIDEWLAAARGPARERQGFDEPGR
jgi:pimeloyl-ACP methyl ester carboxylesterase